MSNDYLSHSVLTDNMWAQSSRGHWPQTGYTRSRFLAKYRVYTIRIQPSSGYCEIPHELRPGSLLDGRPFLPTPLVQIDPTAQAYFKKHKLVQGEGTWVHPWHIYMWSRKVIKREDAFKVMADKTGFNGWMLVPLTPSELKKLPSAVARREAATQAYRTEQAAEQAKLEREEDERKLKWEQARRAQSQAQEREQAVRERAALVQALKITVGSNNISTSGPEQAKPRARGQATRSQRTSLSNDMKKETLSSRRSSYTASTSSRSSSSLVPPQHNF